MNQSEPNISQSDQSQEACIHEFTIPQARLMHSEDTSHGLDTKELIKFVAGNCKQEHLPALRMTTETMDKFIRDSGINFRDFNLKTSGRVDNSSYVNPDKMVLHVETKPIIVDAQGEIHMRPHHEKILKNIVKTIGKNRWEDATMLLLNHFENIIDFDAEDVEIYKRMASYYRTHLDPDMEVREFTEDEEKCIIFMFKMWEKSVQGDAIWPHIARHLAARNGGQVRGRMLGPDTGPEAMTLASLRQHPQDVTRPSVRCYKLGHVIALTIFPKTTAGMEVTVRLQKEVRLLVMGTQEELYLQPCKYTALRCAHTTLQQEKFTYDPTRPGEQFLNFVRLTFANALKKAGVVTKPAFHFSDIKYRGQDIHTIMNQMESERFLLPKKDFLRLNRQQMTISPSPKLQTPKSGQKRKEVSGEGTARGRGRGRPRKIFPN